MPEGVPRRFGYRLGAQRRLTVSLLALFAVFWGFGTASMVADPATREPGIVAGLFILAVVGWQLYWWGLHAAYEVVVEDGLRLRWRRGLGSAEAPVSEIVRARSGYATVIELRGRRRVVVPTRRGVVRFAVMLGRTRPDVPVQVSGWAALVNSTPALGRTYFEEW